MNNILITGGAGYIGSHMICSLFDSQKKYQVTTFDNLSRGFRDACGDAIFIQGDLRSLADINRCFDYFKPDLVMHFAGLSYVGESMIKPADYYENNVIGSLNLLKVMLERDVKKIVFSSSCTTYGKTEALKLIETHTQNPISPYGHSKLIVEKIMAQYGDVSNLSSISLRYFNAAGADVHGRVKERHDPETHLIPLVLREAKRLQSGGIPADTSLEILGVDFPTPDGTCVRDYIHVSDICKAHLLAADFLLSTDSSVTKCYNLSNTRGYSVLEIIAACREITGQPIQYKIAPRREGDPPWLVGDSNLIRSELGWKPSAELKDIISSAYFEG